jgi:hypothetical protein
MLLLRKYVISKKLFYKMTYIFIMMLKHFRCYVVSERSHKSITDVRQRIRINEQFQMSLEHILRRVSVSEPPWLTKRFPSIHLLSLLYVTYTAGCDPTHPLPSGVLTHIHIQEKF